MAIGQSSRVRPSTRTLLIGLGVVVLAALLAVVAGALAWSGASLTSDPVALARVTVQPFGGKLESTQAFGPDGKPIPLAVESGRLTPRPR